jgi:hypothetical protein
MSRGGKEIAMVLAAKLVNDVDGVKSVNRTTIAGSK